MSSIISKMSFSKKSKTTIWKSLKRKLVGKLGFEIWLWLCWWIRETEIRQSQKKRAESALKQSFSKQEHSWSMLYTIHSKSSKQLFYKQIFKSQLRTYRNCIKLVSNFTIVNTAHKPFTLDTNRNSSKVSLVVPLLGVP